MREDATDQRSESGADDPAEVLPTPGAVSDGYEEVLSAALAGVPAARTGAEEAVASAGADAPADRAEGSNGERSAASTDRSATPGTVHLVGGGPGDPDLLTRRAWRLLESADVVLHDSLTGDGIIRELPDDVEVVDVGKRPPNRTSQEEINQLMRERAGADERVVRLKGGDPHVFGRGGEEAEYLASHGVPVDLVPGVSSVLAAPSVSGIPLTHRDRASSVTVITGHETPDKAASALDWAALADTVEAGGTLVVLMGVSRLADNVAALREHGVDPETPVAMVQKATWRDERVVVGTLDDIVDRSTAVDPPAVTIVGDVVDGREAVAEWLQQ